MDQYHFILAGMVPLWCLRLGRAPFFLVSFLFNKNKVREAFHFMHTWEYLHVRLLKGPTYNHYPLRSTRLLYHALIMHRPPPSLFSLRYPTNAREKLRSRARFWILAIFRSYFPSLSCWYSSTVDSLDSRGSAVDISLRVVLEWEYRIPEYRIQEDTNRAHRALWVLYTVVCRALTAGPRRYGVACG